jgi:protease I
MQNFRDLAIDLAVLVSDGFEYRQFEIPVETLKKAGIQVEILAAVKQQLSDGIRAMNHLEPAGRVWPSRLLLNASPQDYAGLLIPGGALSVDAMRESLQIRAFSRSILNEGKPILVAGHAAWILADAGALQGYTLTSASAIRKDLERAGAVWKNCESMRDRNLISFQIDPDCEELLRALRERSIRG